MTLLATIRKRWRLLGASFLVGIASACLAAEPDGTLVIAGGAVSPGNASIYETFIGAMPDTGTGQIAVISAASGEPVSSMQRIRETLERYGVGADRVSHVRLAVMDDETTADVDERTWSGNGNDPAEIAKISAADAIWISGGDQLRLVETLLEQDGAATPMLEAIRHRLSAGAVIGGTSAGAAIMSDPMIARGFSFAALLNDESAGELLRLSRGLGFYPLGLVDQHFDANARLGRLAVALGRLDPEQRIGFGVDEDTALVHVLGEDSITVAGSGNVTFVDGRQGIWEELESGISIRGLLVSVLSPGDRMTADGERLAPSEYLEPTIGKENSDFEPLDGGGIALPSPRLADLLGETLLDNAGATQIDQYSFVIFANDAHGFRFRFRQTPESAGYWGYDPAGQSRHTIYKVRLDIEPIGIQVQAN